MNYKLSVIRCLCISYFACVSGADKTTPPDSDDEMYEEARDKVVSSPSSQSVRRNTPYASKELALPVTKSTLTIVPPSSINTPTNTPSNKSKDNNFPMPSNTSALPTPLVTDQSRLEELSQFRHGQDHSFTYRQNEGLVTPSLSVANPSRVQALASLAGQEPDTGSKSKVSSREPSLALIGDLSHERNNAREFSGPSSALSNANLDASTARTILSAMVTQTTTAHSATTTSTTPANTKKAKSKKFQRGITQLEGDLMPRADNKGAVSSGTHSETPVIVANDAPTKSNCLRCLHCCCFPKKQSRKKQ